MSSLDKVLLAAGSPAAKSPGRQEDPAAELVLAAVSSLEDLRLLLAAPDADDDNDGDEADGNEQTVSGKHADHPTYKQLVKKGLKPAEAAAMCAKADKKVAASALCEGALVALAGLDSSGASGDWVELTAADSSVLRLADGDGSQPYGNVAYADPGYQKDGKKRYPIDKDHIRAAISYFSKPKNHEAYSADQVKSIWGRIKSAARKFGIDLSPDTGKVAATAEDGERFLELAAKQAAMMPAQAHPPFHGTHSHAHVHNGDNMHGPGPDRPDNRWTGGSW